MNETDKNALRLITRRDAQELLEENAERLTQKAIPWIRASGFACVTGDYIRDAQKSGKAIRKKTRELKKALENTTDAYQASDYASMENYALIASTTADMLFWEAAEAAVCAEALLQTVSMQRIKKETEETE